MRKFFPLKSSQPRRKVPVQSNMALSCIAVEGKKMTLPNIPLDSYGSFYSSISVTRRASIPQASNEKDSAQSYMTFVNVPPVNVPHISSQNEGSSERRHGKQDKASENGTAKQKKSRLVHSSPLSSTIRVRRRQMQQHAARAKTTSPIPPDPECRECAIDKHAGGKGEGGAVQFVIDEPQSESSHNAIGHQRSGLGEKAVSNSNATQSPTDVTVTVSHATHQDPAFSDTDTSGLDASKASVLMQNLKLVPPHPSGSHSSTDEEFAPTIHVTVSGTDGEVMSDLTLAASLSMSPSYNELSPHDASASVNGSDYMSDASDEYQPAASVLYNRSSSKITKTSSNRNVKKVKSHRSTTSKLSHSQHKNDKGDESSSESMMLQSLGSNDSDANLSQSSSRRPSVVILQDPSLVLSVDNDYQPDRQVIENQRKPRTHVTKRERVERKRVLITDSPPSRRTGPEIQQKHRDSWIYGDEDYSTEAKKDQSVQVIVNNNKEPPLPEIRSPSPPPIGQQPQGKAKRNLALKTAASIKQKSHGAKKRDTSYEDSLRRQKLAEERRKKQMATSRNPRYTGAGEMLFGEDGGPNFDDYGFLAKYCIFNKGSIEMYHQAFNSVDEDQLGWLSGTDVLIALRGINNKLTIPEEEYLYRILELTGYKVTDGADFKIFSVIAGLSQRITALDNWMRNIIGRIDFKFLEMKMFMCKTLWECNVDPSSNTISIDQLCIELRAGGVSFEHECEVREKLGHMVALDLLDFLTYIPLFIMIHESVVDNPLNDIRNK